MAYLKETFAVGAANTNDNKSLPGEPLVILYNDKATELTPAQSLASANIILAIGRGGDGVSRYNNQDYFVIDFAKHEEEILSLTEDVAEIFAYIEEAKKTIAEMQNAITKNAEDIQNIIKKIGEKGDSPEKDTVYGYIEGAYNSIKDEINRAENAEQNLQHSLQDEVTRAKAEETRIQSNLDAESARAKDVELNLQNDLEAERDRALAAEEANRDAIENEVARAINAEALLQTNIDAETSRAKTNETRIEDLLNAEIARSKDAENKLASDIHLEYERAFKAEGDLNKRVDDEVLRATTAEKANSDAINAETLERKNADDALTTKINNDIATEATARENADNILNEKVDTAVESLTNKINTEVSTERTARENADYALNTKIDTATSTLETKITTDVEAERNARISADDALLVRIDANNNSIISNKVKSDGKTIIVTGPTENGTNLEVNVDNKTIVINETGTLSVASDALVQYKGANSIHVSEVLGGSKTISLTVNENDKILTNDDNGLLATLSLKWVHAEADGQKDEIQLIGKNDTVISSIDVADFIKDGMLDTIKFDTTDVENPKLVFTFNTSAGKEAISINVKELIDVYVAGNGIEINNNVISAKIDVTGEHFLTVSNEGIKLNGIQSAIDLAKTEINSSINTEVNKLNVAVETLDAKLNAETNNRLESDTKIREDYLLADSNITKAYKDADTLLETAYKAADSEIIANYQAAVALVDSEYKSADAAIIADYKNADDAIKALVSTVDLAIKNEVIARETADNTINENIAKILPEAKVYTDNAISTEKSRAELAEQNLLAKIDTNVNAINVLNGDTTVDGSVKDMIFDSALGTVATTVTLEDANQQSLIKKFTLDGVPYFYTSNSTSDMKHNGSALNVVIDEIRSDFSGIETSLTDLTNSLNVVKSDVVNNTADIETNKQAIAETKTDVELNTQSIAEVKEDVKGLEEEVTNKVNTLLASMQATIDLLTAKVTALESELAAVKNDVNTVKETAITNIKGTDNEIKVEVSGNTATVGFADDAYFIAGY
jgi:hypothetical protein